MVRKWGATGVGKARHLGFALTPSIKAHIQTQIESANLKPKNGYSQFFESVEAAVRLFRESRDMGADSSPARIRENLRNIQRRALDLNAAFNQLDGNSIRILAQYVNLDEVRSSQLGELIGAVQKAIGEAESLPKRGRLPDNARIILVLELAHIFENQLGIKFTTRNGSEFSSLVSIIYQEATGGSRKGEVHELLRSSGKWCRLENSDGTVEFLPREEI